MFQALSALQKELEIFSVEAMTSSFMMSGPQEKPGSNPQDTVMGYNPTENCTPVDFRDVAPVGN